MCGTYCLIANVRLLVAVAFKELKNFMEEWSIDGCEP